MCSKREIYDDSGVQHLDTDGLEFDGSDTKKIVFDFNAPTEFNQSRHKAINVLGFRCFGIETLEPLYNISLHMDVADFSSYGYDNFVCMSGNLDYLNKLYKVHCHDNTALTFWFRDSRSKNALPAYCLETIPENTNDLFANFILELELLWD